MAEKYAIIASGGKQYRVEPGAIIDVELLDAGENETVTFNEVLFHNGSANPSDLSKLSVKGEVLGSARGPKVVSYKYKQRKNIRKKKGHRQHYTRVKITEIGRS